MRLRVLPLLALCLAFAGEARAFVVPFDGPNAVESLADPTSVRAADFDRDGDLDLVSITQTAGGAVTWFENDDGSGSSWTAHTIAVKVSTGSSASPVDIDGDGDVDVLATLPSANSTVWYENTSGDGSSWAAAQVVNDTGSGQVSSVAGDFDRDGDLDVAVGSSSAIRWFANLNGDGSTWSAANSVAILVSRSAVHIDVADVDRDGWLDVVAAWDHASSAGVAWYRNTGSFALGEFYSLGIDGPVWVAPARMDPDADIDLVVATESGEMFWLDNTNGAGTSLSLVAISFSGGGPRAVLPFDIDGDSDLDVLVPLSDELRWYENADSFGASWIPRDVPTPGGAVLRSAVVADVDGDGDPDLDASSTSGDELFFDRNQFVHRSAAATENTVASALPTQVISAVAVADMDGDGDDDAIGANYSTDTITWYENNFGTGWSPTAVGSGPDVDGVWDLATADVDRDGDPDVLGVATHSDTVSWFENSSGGTSFSQNVIVNIHSGPSAISSADINSDGDPDVLVAFGAEGRFSWYDNTSGNGTTWTERVVAGSVTQPVDIVASDVDRDGDLDVFGLSVGDQTLRWYENTSGNGTSWSAHVISAATGFANAVAIADVDGDGDVDAATYGSNQLLAWHENTAGNGSAWSSATISTESNQGRALVFTDFDLDGDPDLIAAPGDTSAATFWENEDGSGTTWIEHALAGPAFPTGWQQAIAVTDVQGDGAPDLLIAHGDAAQLSWYANALRHVGLVSANLAPGALLSATTTTVLSIDVTHQGRQGDLPALFDVLELRLTDGFNEFGGLTTGQADALIASLSLYADDGNLIRDGGDTFVGGLGTFSLGPFGLQTLDLNETLPQLQIGAEETRRFFIAVEMMSDAHAQPVHTFRIWARGNFTDDFPSPLSLLELGSPTRVIVAASTVSDYDGDGARDLVESGTGTYVSPINLGSDPFDADSDDDGFSDGFEVVARTNPTLLASASASMPFTAVDAGISETSCGILSDGELSCWGSNVDGMATPPAGAFRHVTIGDGFACALRSSYAPACWGDNGWQVVAETDPNYADISAGAQHVCGLRFDGTLECWGTNSFGLFNEPAGAFRGVASGSDFACALNESGVPVCWGNPANGRTAPPPGEVFLQIDAGSGHACGLRANGSALCWGLGTSGQTTVPPASYTQITAGDGFSCGLRSDATLACWGSFFADIPNLSPYLEVSADGPTACARRADGRAVCFGALTSLETTAPTTAFRDVALGALHGCVLGATRRAVCWGDSSSGKTTPPVTSDVAAIGLGDQHSCVIEQDGDAQCFGSNANGEAANQAASGNPFVQIDGGTGHTCGVRADASVTCWGANGAGQGTPDPASYVQVSAGGINNAAAHTCGITTTGALRCWGTNTLGQATDQSGTWLQVSAGQAFSCGVRTDGTLGCFGQDLSGQVSGAPPGFFSEVAAGRFHACARGPNGTVRCWGSSTDGKTTPPPGRFVRIAAAADRSCGVLENGSVACWGANAVGETWPPLDGDVDAREDGADNCASAENPSQLDADLDGVGDGVCDLCPGLYDPIGLDRDADGVGDACDNCIDVENPGQEDIIGGTNGIGDACESTLVFIRPTPPPPPPGPPPGPSFGPGPPPPPPAGEALYDVLLYCPTTPIGKVQLGVIMPEGATAANVNFGLGCTPTSCAGAVGNGLGAMVNAAASLAKGPNPAFVSAGARGDTVYFSIQANPGVTLCDPDGPELEVRVAQFQIANPLPDAPTPSLTKEGLSAPPVNLLEPLTDNTGRVLEPAEYSFASLNQDPSVALTLEPAAGDTTGRRWQVEFDTDVELHRVTFGLVAPAGTNTSQMRFLGCTTPAGPQPTRRSCAVNSALGPYVNPHVSYSVGPGASTSGLRTDTLYVSVAGLRPSGAAQPALNIAPQPAVLGVVELDTTTAAPALTLDGVGTSSVFGTAYVNTSNTAVGTPLVQVGSGYNAPSDYDADGRSDDLDNCPYTANLNQANNGGFLTTTPDLYGDTCQCADGDGNGAVFAADTAALRAVLTGQAPASVAARCSVAGGPECDVRDYAVFRRAIAGLGPGISSVCASAVRGSQLPTPP